MMHSRTLLCTSTSLHTVPGALDLDEKELQIFQNRENTVLTYPQIAITSS